MLVVGEVGWGGELHPTRVTPDEQYSHISLWSLLAAPLLLGNELVHLDPFTRNLLTNDEVIAIDQDPAGRAAQRVYRGDNWEIWVRELQDGRKAVGIFNFGDRFRRLPLAHRVESLAIGLPLRDVWKQEGLGSLTDDFAAAVPEHGVLLLTVGKGHHRGLSLTCGCDTQGRTRSVARGVSHANGRDISDRDGDHFYHSLSFLASRAN